ncbi:MAG: FIST N-terminal domain-containing protein [Pseudomonadota bacterium]
MESYQQFGSAVEGLSMMFASAVTNEQDETVAITQLVTQVQQQLEARSVDLAILFVSPHFRLTAGNVSALIREVLQPTVLLGCTAEGVIGRDVEFEHGPGMTLVAAHLPNVSLAPFSLQSMGWPKLLDEEDAFRRILGATDESKLFILLVDPFTAPIDDVLTAFNTFLPNLPVVGGLASGSHRPGGNALFFNDRIVNNGAIGVALSGKFDVDVIVSQGCRPIGEPFRITESQDNVILSLDHETPFVQLQNLVRQLSETDQDLLRNGVFIGRAINSAQEILGRGDFLIRGVMGLDQNNGAMIVSDYMQVGETVQFHLRDASTAEEDLEMMLTPQMLFDPPAGALLFSCNGRGTRLYDHPNGDISIIQNVVGDLDLAGFFCAGEIGPIGGKNFLHAHTASLVMFRP